MDPPYPTAPPPPPKMVLSYKGAEWSNSENSLGDNLVSQRDNSTRGWGMLHE